MLEWTKPEYIGIKWGHSNYLPTPFKEIELDSFMRLMHNNSFSLQGINFQQCYTPEDAVLMNNDTKLKKWPAIHNTKFYFYHSLAVACMPCVIDMKETYKDKYNIPFYETSSNNKLKIVYRFFRLGCEHKNTKREDHGNCDHTDICQDCDYKFGYNSGD